MGGGVGTLNELVIDCRTEGAINGVRALAELDGAVVVSGPHPYSEDGSYSQILYSGSMTEDEMDSWLYENHVEGFEYVGVVELPF